MNKNFLAILSISVIAIICTQEKVVAQPTLTDSITTKYLYEHLKKSHPRMVISSEDIPRLKQMIKTDSLTQHSYQLIKKQADKIIKQDVIKREMEGRVIEYFQIVS